MLQSFFRNGSKLLASALVIALGSTAAFAAASAPTPQEPQQALASFEPKPGSITIQAFDERPELGDTLVTVRLDGQEMERLARETGHTSFIVLGPEGAQTLLRDDGIFPDAKSADAVFSTLALSDRNALQARSERDQQNFARSNGVNLAFDGRAIVGEKEVSPFDFESFAAGLPVALAPSISSLTSPTPGFTTAFQRNVLMITHPGVVTDPTRTIDPCNPPAAGSLLPAWSFGRLMTDMANPGLTGINPSVFVEDWLSHWLSNQTINTFTVNQRLAMQTLINNWHAASPGPLLDLRLAPFRLVAIVPRIDLRETTTGGGGYGGTASGTNFLNAGEGRFVFAVMDPFGPGCAETPFTVILEYGVPLNSCKAVKRWAQDWQALDTLVIGSPLYNSALQNLTDVFAAAGADPSKPNHSAINQVRTNENELNPLWELREFRLLDPTPSLLSQTTVANTPDNGFNNTSDINSFIGAGSPSPMPLNHPVTGNPFLGGASETPTPSFFWNGNPSMPGPASGRHDFSLNTCNGCHGGETDTFFVHINPAPTGPLSFLPLLSDFLVGANVTDPVDGTVRFFDDLDRREIDINNVAGMSCLSLVPFAFDHVSLSVQENGVLPEDIFLENNLQTVKSSDLGIDGLLSPPIQQVH